MHAKESQEQKAKPCLLCLYKINNVVAVLLYPCPASNTRSRSRSPDRTRFVGTIQPPQISFVQSVHLHSYCELFASDGHLFRATLALDVHRGQLYARCHRVLPSLPSLPPTILDAVVMSSALPSNMTQTAQTHAAAAITPAHCSAAVGPHVIGFCASWRSGGR